MIVGAEYNTNLKSIVASYYNSIGQLSKITKRVPENEAFVWRYSENQETPYKGWDNKSLTKSPTQYLSRYRIEELIMSIFSKQELDLLYSTHKPFVHFLDIETQVNENNDFPYPEKAEFPVNLISIVFKNKVYVLSTLLDIQPDDIDVLQNEVNDYFKSSGITTNYEIVFKYFNNEYSMLALFFHKFLPHISLLTGWNVIDFDWQTLYNRADKLGIQPLRALWSDKTMSQFKIPIHLGLLDYMEICQEFKPIKMAENYTLDYTAEKILGVKKLKHPYKSMFEFQKDGRLFTKYNIIDTCIVDQIEIKKQLLNIAYEMANISRIEVSKIFGPVFKTEIFLCREFFKKNLHMPEISKSNKKMKYPGAFVMQPTPGFYEYVGCFDFASQYPNIQMQWNISPETYLGKTKDVDMSKLDMSKVTITKNDTVFLTDRDSVSRIIQSELFGKRKSIKGKNGEMQTLKKEIDQLKHQKDELIKNNI